MQTARKQLDVQLRGDTVVNCCDDDLEVTVAPELRDAIRCLPGSCILHIDPFRLPTVVSRAATAAGERRVGYLTPLLSAHPAEICSLG